MSLKEAALVYCQRGWSVFPLHDKRRPHVPWKKYQTERADEAQVKQWWSDWPDAFIGLALGGVSGVVRIDVDGPGGLEQFQKLGGCPDTSEFATQSGGRGWLLKWCDGVTTSTLWTGEGEHNELRLQSTGAYTVLPPSPGYSWINESPPAQLPVWLLDYYSGLMIKQLEKELRPTLKLPDVQQVTEALGFLPAYEYDKWIGVGMALHNASGDTSMLELWDKWSATCVEKYVPGECKKRWNTFVDGGLTTRTILYWAEPYGYRPLNRHEPLTELGNARILARMGEGRILHSAVWGWLRWTGTHWTREEAEKYVVELQKEVLEHRMAKACESMSKLAKSDDEDVQRRRKSKLAFMQAIRRHEDERSIRGARTLAESEPTLSVDYRAFDKDPWTLNCANGKLNLRNGELLDHDPSDRVTNLCPTEYVEGAQAPRWMQFLDEVFSDRLTVSWVQKLMGYCLTGVVKEHVLPIFHGVGRNGKSTFVKAIMTVLGQDYSGTTPSGFLTVARGEQHPTKLVSLYGKRFVADLETGDGARLDEELVKRVTGGDQIKARRLYEDFWYFEPSHKLILCTNCEPKVKGVDIAIWSRLKLVPFLRVFEGAKQDTSLAAQLQNEAPGILSWMVEGCFLWQREGLGDTPEVSRATEEYKGTQDSVSLFASDRLERAEGAKCKVADVYSAYKGWSMGQNLDQVNIKTFRAIVEKLGFSCDATGKWYTGMKL